MQYLIAIPLLTGLTGLIFSVIFAPYIKEDLDRQGLKNTFINILSWRPKNK